MYMVRSSRYDTNLYQSKERRAACLSRKEVAEGPQTTNSKQVAGDTCCWITWI